VSGGGWGLLFGGVVGAGRFWRVAAEVSGATLGPYHDGQLYRRSEHGCDGGREQVRCYRQRVAEWQATEQGTTPQT
jgi:hypothetical protein